MPTTWNIGVDWNRDGFLCRDARPGDALNLLPAPLTHATLSSAGFSGATCARCSHFCCPHKPPRCAVMIAAVR